MSDNTHLPSAPPAYGSVEQPGAAQAPYPPPPVSTQPLPQEPPPKYEMPKEGPYAATEQPQAAPPPGQYPPQAQYPPQGYQTGTTVHQTVIVTHPNFGPHPMTLQCPNCHATVTTCVTYNSGGMAWLTCGLLCLFGCWAGCCLIPFCIPDLMDAEHRCPNCSRHIGTFRRL